MGTNYYTEKEPPCPACGEGGKSYHIGKSSAGWKFCFAPCRREGIDSWEGWQAFLSNRVIKDEYGKVVDLADLKTLVEAKQNEGRVGSDAYEFSDAQGYRFSKQWDFS